MKLPLLLQWPLCKQPNTLSFRAGDDHKLRTLKSAHFYDVETAESWLTKSSEEESPTFSTDHPKDMGGKSLEVEEIVRGVKSERRLFFEPAGDTRLVPEEDDQKACGFPFKESLVIEMESQNPYLDFRSSMKEMVETHNCFKDWECLEELLGWYLEANGKANHGFIVEAFVDLLVDGQNMGSSCTHYSFSSAASFSLSSPSSLPSALAEDEIDEEDN